MANFTIEVVARTRSAEGNLSRLNDRLRRTESTAGLVARRLRSMLGVIAGGAVFSAALRQITEFQDAMAQVGVVTGASTSQMNRMISTVRSLGRRTRFSAGQAADGLLLLGRAGLNAEQSIQALGATLNFAQAAQLSVAEAADIATNVMSGFGQEVENLEGFMDVLVGTANRSNTNVRQLGSAMSYVAPIANSLGLDLETASAALGTMGDSGIQATRAATGLRGVFAALAAPAGAAADELARLNLSLADVDVRSRGLPAVLETLRGAGVDTASAYRLFGREAATSALVLIENNERLRDLRSELFAVRGEAREASTALGSTLGGAVANLFSAFSDLFIVLGEGPAGTGLAAAINALAAAVRGLADVINILLVLIGAYFVVRVVKVAIATVRWYQSIAFLRFAIRELIEELLEFWGFAGRWVKAIGRIFRVLAIGIGAVFSIKGAIAIGLILFAEYLIDTREEGESWGHALGRVFRNLWDTIRAPLTAIGTALGNLGSLWSALWDVLTDPTQTPIDRIKTTLSDLLKTLAQDIPAAAKRAAGGVDAAGGSIGRGFNDPFAGFDPSRFVGAGETGGAATVFGPRGSGVGQEALARQAELLNNIKQPLRDYTQQIKDLEALRDDGLITTRQFTVEYERLSKALDNARGQTEAERKAEEALNAERDATDRLFRQVTGASQDYLDTQRRLRDLLGDSRITLDQYNQALLDLEVRYNNAESRTNRFGESLAEAREQMRQMANEIQLLSPSEFLERVNAPLSPGLAGGFGQSSAEAGFGTGFQEAVARDLESLRSFAVEAGAIFASIGQNLGSTIGRQIGQLLVGAQSLGDAFANIAAVVVNQLIASFVQLGIRMLTNALIGQKIVAATSAAATAQAATLTAAWYPPALLSAIATGGGSVAAGTAALTTALTAGSLLSTVASAATSGALGGSAFAFQDGGYVRGPGGPRDDRIPARLSPGEFVVNARSTAQHRQELEAINSGRAPQPTIGNITINVQGVTDADSFRRSERQITDRMARTLARSLERG